MRARERSILLVPLSAQAQNLCNGRFVVTEYGDEPAVELQGQLHGPWYGMALRGLLAGISHGWRQGRAHIGEGHQRLHSPPPRVSRSIDASQQISRPKVARGQTSACPKAKGAQVGPGMGSWDTPGFGSHCNQRDQAMQNPQRYTLPGAPFPVHHPAPL